MTLGDIIYDLRKAYLHDETSVNWDDDELLGHARKGISRLWRRIVDVYENHFLTIDSEHAFIDANATQISGIPDDCYRVVLVEPRVIGPSSLNPGLVFKPKKWQDPMFLNARATSPIAPTEGIIYYQLHEQGPPIGPPVVRIGPAISSSMLLTIAYNQRLPVETYDEDTDNPIPGDSDHALTCWIVAHAKTKDREDQRPDRGWLDDFDTELATILTSLAPRQVQEQEHVEGFMEGIDY